MVKAFLYRFTICTAVMFFIAVNPAYSDTQSRQAVSSFNHHGLSGWEEKHFKGRTFYQVHELDHEKVLQAESQASASGLFKKVQIDLKKTPYLNWRWRIENRIYSGDETVKSGDDYAARVYLLIGGGVFFWKTRALSYVWANSSPRGKIWNNAYAGKSVKMMALRSADEPTKVWVTERRNVYEDLKRTFGEEISVVDAVAVMTDTDNSGSQVKAYYADIFFSAE